MAQKYERLCSQILSEIGGKKNVAKAMNCATRLRIELKDKTLVNQENVKAIKDVLGCQFVNDQFQIIIGPHVNDVCKEFTQMVGISMGEEIDENLDHIPEKKNWNIKTIFSSIFETLSGCILPIFPIFVGAGLIKMLVAILGPNLMNLCSAESDLIVLLTLVGDAGFYYFPMFAAWSAAKYFKTSFPVALFLAGVLIHPAMLQMVADGTSLSVYGIPMTLVSYPNQFLPSVLMVWVLSYVYRYVEKVCPNSLRMVFVPLASVLIMLPIVLCVLGPLGTIIGVVIGDAANWLSTTVGPLAIGLIGGLWYFLVALGMDKALIPIILNAFATQGYDNLFWLSAVVATYALIGVAAAYFFRSKKEEKAMAGSNAITLMFGGVSEPTIFGCILRFKKAMIYLFAGGFVGGILVSILNVKAYAIGAGNILFATIFAGGDGASFLPGVIACVVAFGISFGLGIIFGFHNDGKAKFKLPGMK